MKQIVFARIDDRLIHGQVMTAWLSSVMPMRLLLSTTSFARIPLWS